MALIQKTLENSVLKPFGKSLRGNWINSTHHILWMMSTPLPYGEGASSLKPIGLVDPTQYRSVLRYW
ncbi:MAG: hypothetical protein KME57_30945 [Scytonema hyalinum WJT4-NPBG1]|nr:hypothetical protein [Scytonema hyalinum WJT4-NPBG1]